MYTYTTYFFVRYEDMYLFVQIPIPVYFLNKSTYTLYLFSKCKFMSSFSGLEEGFDKFMIALAATILTTNVAISFGKTFHYNTGHVNLIALNILST